MKSTVMLFPLLGFLTVSSCTSKYVIYPTIDKNSFGQQEANQIKHNPITPKLLPANKVSHEACFDQWLFMNNAYKDTDRFLPDFFRHTCPGTDYLVNTKVTRKWWTTLIYSQSCVEIQGFCARKARAR